jgi:glutamate-1-semialdehyde aminotransferase
VIVLGRTLGDVSSDLATMANRLSYRFPAVERRTVVAVLTEAVDTVVRVVGRRDLALAEDLAQLRLDVRNRRTH